MQHFPIFLNTKHQRIVVSGAGEHALPKLRLLKKTEARIAIFASDVSTEVADFANIHQIEITRRMVTAPDLHDTLLVYCANEYQKENIRVARLSRQQGVFYNIVDNLNDSAFLTPAIVDREPVTVAIGTEGAAPVLARSIKRDLEEKLPSTLGRWAEIGKAFRPSAEALPQGRARREFWSDYYFGEGQRTDHPEKILPKLLEKHLNADTRPGRIDFVGAGPGPAELLTLRARNLLHEADIVFHDPLVTSEILELARREADIRTNRVTKSELVAEARKGAQVVVLMYGDGHSATKDCNDLNTMGITASLTPGLTVPNLTIVKSEVA